MSQPVVFQRLDALADRIETVEVIVDSGWGGGGIIDGEVIIPIGSQSQSGILRLAKDSELQVGNNILASTAGQVATVQSQTSTNADAVSALTARVQAIEDSTESGEYKCSVPVGFEAMWPGVTPPVGWLDESLYNGLLPRETYPDLWAFALASGNLIDDTSWQTQANTRGTCGSFSTGDGINTFRIPLLRRVFTRARDPHTGDLVVGQYQEDTMRPVTGTSTLHGTAAPATLATSLTTTGALTTSPNIAGRYINYVSTSNATSLDFAINSALLGSNYDGTETRPVSVVRMPIIKALDVITNSNSTDIADLIYRIDVLNDTVSDNTARIDVLEGSLGDVSTALAAFLR